MQTKTMPADKTSIHEDLERYFGFKTFRKGQEAVIEKLMAGKSVVAIFPTGAGKSLCFQLPALKLPGLTLVISPLIALMKDQIDFLQSRNLPAARLDSTLSQAEVMEVYDGLRANTIKLLYVSPERLNNERFLDRLQGLTISMLVIDEAHCISEWGHNFRPDYLKLAPLAKSLKAERVLCLTATATPGVAQDIRKAFSIDETDEVHTGFYRSNLDIVLNPQPLDRRLKALKERIQANPSGPAIVYVTLQKTAESVAKALPGAKAYHAGMKDEARTAVQQWFMESDRAVVVATIAFGMGIDKSNIRAVYHYNLPKSLENYAQEIGRAGRDGEQSVCEMMGYTDDLGTLQNFTYGDTPTREAIAGMIQHIDQAETEFSLSHYEISGQNDVRPLVVSTLMTYLSLDGLIETTSPFYTGYQFAPKRSQNQILGAFKGDPLNFLTRLFTLARKGPKWMKLDMDEVERAGLDRGRVVKALNHLEERGDIDLTVTGLRIGYRKLQQKWPVDALVDDLFQRFQRREQADLDRLDKVTKLVNHASCTNRALMHYFGEKIELCGHCGICQGGKPAPMPSLQELHPETPSASKIRALQGENHPALSTPRQLARFLVGVSSPAASRARLTRDPRFGSMADLPFNAVLHACETPAR
ncbi:MAG: ATP-dependent DNA helicase RecQ [Candidatus Omnitrophota bacterium]|jgi:ATP-dependent DNA helicase RecQ